MIAVEGDERDGRTAALEVGTLETAAAGGRLGDVGGLAAIVLDELVGEADAAVEGQDAVIDAVDAEVGDRVTAAFAAADEAASQNGNCTEIAGTGAGEGVGHAATKAEACREARSRVDAEVSLELLDDGVNEGDVLATLVGPAVVEAIGGNEDGAAGSAGFQAVPGLDAVAVGNIGHATAAPVQAEYQVVGVAVVVVFGHQERVLAAVEIVDAGG